MNEGENWRHLLDSKYALLTHMHAYARKTWPTNFPSNFRAISLVPKKKKRRLSVFLSPFFHFDVHMRVHSFHIFPESIIFCFCFYRRSRFYHFTVNYINTFMEMTRGQQLKLFWLHLILWYVKSTAQYVYRKDGKSSERGTPSKNQLIVNTFNRPI